MKSGIYLILSFCDYKVYVGQSKDIGNRFQAHKYKLKHNKHHNKHLQSAYNKYGVSNFIFQIIEECPEEIRDEREKFWIDELKSINKQFGYNREHGGSLNKTPSKETRRKMSESHKKSVTQDMVDDVILGMGQVAFTHKYNYSNQIWYRIKREWRNAS